jgi:hypothetical protein
VTVRRSFDGRAFQTHHRSDASAPHDWEAKVLRLLGSRGCGFVLTLLEANPQRLRIITRDCSTRAKHLEPESVCSASTQLSHAEQSGFLGSGFDLASTCDALADQY